MTRKNMSLLKHIAASVKSSAPDNLASEAFSPIRNDHSANIESLVLRGHTRLAADHILFPEANEILLEIIAGAIRRLGLHFFKARIDSSADPDSFDGNIVVRHRCYGYLLETALNLFGLESRCLEDDEKELAVDFILETLSSWEQIEISEYGAPLIAAETVESILRGMDIVQAGASMVSKSAARIRESMRKTHAPVSISFLDSANHEIQDNIYFHLALDGKCKFGNDYALGLRWLRHLGFEQVSTNPVLAAKAYDDDPSLAETFKSSVAANPDFSLWQSAPEKHADDITLYATLLALWDNLHVYRPVFYNLAETTGGGVVSFQLNPNLAHLAAESVGDAFKALELAQKNLEVYDSYLLAGYNFTADLGRPNMVIKVAASSPAAKTIAETINAYGLGSNITVVYTVAQEVTLILSELKGMAAAVAKGIIPTQLYMTNMGGRFESHIREEALLSLFDKLKKSAGEEKALKSVLTLAKSNGTSQSVKAASGYRQKVFEAICFKNGTKEITSQIEKALSGVAARDELELLESDIQKSGTLVARRVWHVFFSEKNREKWTAWLSEAFDISEAQAAFILSRVNVLPASKRKPLDTLLTLSADNMVHTEFGNHQENVFQLSLKKDFDIFDYTESIRDDFGPDVVERLCKLPDFPQGYEINKELQKVFKQAGIVGDFGSRGLLPADWQNYGAVKKTLDEFKAAYNSFKSYILSVFPS